MPLRVVSFDAVGTLIRLREPVAATYAVIAAVHGVRVDEARLAQAFGRQWVKLPPPLHPPDQPPDDDDRSWWRNLVERVFEDALQQPLPAETMTPLFEQLYGHYAQSEAWIAFEDVLPVLDDLATGHTLCVCSNFDLRLPGILEGLGLKDFFARIIVSSVAGASKPHERMFSAVTQLADGDAGACLHVGDDIQADVAGAAAAGLHAFHVSRPENGLDSLVRKVRSDAYSSLHAAQSQLANAPLFAQVAQR